MSLTFTANNQWNHKNSESVSSKKKKFSELKTLLKWVNLLTYFLWITKEEVTKVAYTSISVKQKSVVRPLTPSRYRNFEFRSVGWFTLGWTAWLHFILFFLWMPVRLGFLPSSYSEMCSSAPYTV